MIGSWIRITVMLALPALCLSCISSASAAETEVEKDPLRLAARNGDAQAQQRLGEQYFYGRNRTRNYTLAALWFRKAAEQKNPVAMFDYAMCLENGLGVDKNPYEAFLLYQQAFRNGVKAAGLKVASIYMHGLPGGTGDKPTPPVLSDRDRALEIYERLRTEKYIPAWRELANWYLAIPADERDEDDLRKVYEYAKYAAENGDAVGMRLLGDCYFIGIGCKRDEKAMFEWMDRAARRGDLEAVAKVAYCYEYGQGAAQDDAKAFDLYMQAASGGHPMALYKLGEFYSTGRYVKEDPVQAVECYKAAAKADSHHAWFKLGILAAQGIGMPKSDRKSAEYFMTAAKLGNVYAQYNLACYYTEGRGLPVDLSAAAFWFKKAADKGNLPSARRYGLCLIKGLGVPVNKSEGKLWLNKAADGGDQEAQKMLLGDNTL